MKSWNELNKEVWKIQANKQTALSIMKMVDVRIYVLENSIKFLDLEKSASVLVEDCYKIIKELITGIMEMDGYKTLSHEALICYISEYYKIFSENDIVFLDDLRKLRNKISYKGFFVRKDYLDRNKKLLDKLIKKFKKLLEDKMK